jgi:hypothetical protein
MLTYYYGNWDYWGLHQKVTFDGVNKLILISSGVTTLDVKQDLYSDWKEWVLLRDNSKYLPAIRSIGGESLPGGKFIGATFFLTNGWRIRTWEGHHTLTVVGNLFTEEGDSVFVPTLDHWTITINAFQSTLVDGVTGLTSVQADKLMSLNNVDIVGLIDGVWDKVLPNGVPVKDYITYKLLTTNKFIGLS